MILIGFSVTLSKLSARVASTSCRQQVECIVAKRGEALLTQMARDGVKGRVRQADLYSRPYKTKDLGGMSQ